MKRAARVILIDAPLVLVGSAALALVLFEGYLRIRDDGLQLSELFQPDYELSYRLKPHLVGSLSGTHVAINALGLRSDGEILPKRDGELRILCMGDSMTFGLGLEADETWPAQLEERLRARFPGRAVSVINAGIPSYDTYNEWLFLEDLAPAVEPDLVLVGFWNNDDGVGVHWRNRDRPGFMFLKWLTYNSRTFSMLRGLVLGRPTVVPPPPEGAETGEGAWQALRAFQVDSNPDFAYIVAGFEGLARWQQATGKPVVVVHLPKYTHAMGFDRMKLLYQRIEALSTSHGLRHIDLRSAYRDFPGDPRDLSLLEPLNDDHTSALGNALIAAAIEEGIAPLVPPAAAKASAPL